MFERAVILGLGLMGGSLGLAMRTRGLARQVLGVDRNGETLAKAEALGAIDRGLTELEEAVHGANCIVLATPVGQIPALLERLAPLVGPEALVTDLGSVKTQIVECGARMLGARFVGGHPMAGSERSGIEAARADLFTGAAWAVVSGSTHSELETTTLSRLVGLVEALEARPIFLDGPQHDRLVALVSHLPHLLSFAFAGTVHADPDAVQARSLAGGSYRDLMRVAQSDPLLWQGILQANRAALLQSLSDYRDVLAELESALRSEDPSLLRSLLLSLPRN